MTILFAENFHSCGGANNVATQALLVRRYPGSRYLVTSTAPGFALGSIAAATTGGTYTGGQLLQTNIKELNGSKYEIVLNFPGVAGPGNVAGGTYYVNVFGLNLSSATNSITVRVQGLDVGLRNTSRKLHVILTKRSDGLWDAITEVTTGSEVTVNKNIVSYTPTGIIEAYGRNASNASMTLNPVSMPREITSVAFLEDTPAGMKTDVTFSGVKLTASENQGWTATDQNVDDDVAKPNLTALDPAIVADVPDASIVYSNASPTPDGVTQVSLATQTTDPRTFIKVGEAPDSVLMRYEGTVVQQAAGPIVGGDTVKIAAYPSPLVSWVDVQRASLQQSPTIALDRVASNIWEYTTTRFGTPGITFNKTGGPFDGAYLDRPVGTSGFLKMVTPPDFTQTDFTVQFWVQPDNTSSEQRVFGIGTNNDTSGVFIMAVAWINGKMTVQAAVNKANLSTIGEVSPKVAGQREWFFVTLQVARVNYNLDVTISVDEHKLNNNPLRFQPPQTPVITYLSSHQTSGNAFTQCKCADLYVSNGYDPVVPIARPTVASPWPAL